jgi:hypothetical protein
MGYWAWQRRWNRAAIKVVAPAFALMGALACLPGVPRMIRTGTVADSDWLAGSFFLGGLIVSIILIRAGIRRRRSESPRRS